MTFVTMCEFDDGAGRLLIFWIYVISSIMHSWFYGYEWMSFNTLILKIRKYIT